LLVVLLYLNHLKNTLEASMRIPLGTLTLSMIFQSLDSVLRMELSTGLLETVGALTGVKMVFSESSEEQTTLLLNQIALGPLLKTHGLLLKSIKLVTLREMIHQMMLRMDLIQKEETHS
jgi:hypothetical protein